VLITSSYQASIEGFRQRGLGEDDVRRLFQRTLQLAHVRRHHCVACRVCVCACVVCAVWWVSCAMRVVCASDIKLTWREQQEARAEFWADEDRRRGREWPLVAASIGPYGTVCVSCVSCVCSGACAVMVVLTRHRGDLTRRQRVSGRLRSADEPGGVHRLPPATH
jgi:S-methylmethionine-dependent homocysteine/selenocysteine methylase